jgi:hypothetical protein
MGAMSDRDPNELQVDEALWFVSPCRASGGNDRHFLVANPHTHRGRMSAWCRTGKRAFAVSKGEMLECSDAARVWIAGFLTGNEPEPPTNADGDALHPDEPAMIRWYREIELFHETGVWVATARECPQCKDALLRSQPGLVCAKCSARGPTAK